MVSTALALLRTINCEPSSTARLITLSHGLLFVAIYASAYLLRFDFRSSGSKTDEFLSTPCPGVVIRWPSFLGCVIFNAGNAMPRCGPCNLGSGGITVIALCRNSEPFLFGILYPPRRALLDFCGTILSLGALRSVWRLVEEHAIPLVRGDSRGRAVLIGAEQADKILAQRLQSYSGFPYSMCGFLDRDSAKTGYCDWRCAVVGDDQGSERCDHARRNHRCHRGFRSLPGHELRQVWASANKQTSSCKSSPARTDVSRQQTYPAQNPSRLLISCGATPWNSISRRSKGCLTTRPCSSPALAAVLAPRFAANYWNFPCKNWS